MPPRIPILGALRHPSTLIRAQTVNFSSTPVSPVVRKDIQSVASSLLSSVDQPPATSTSSEEEADPTRAASNLFERLGGSRRALEEELRQRNLSEDYARQMTRRWGVGDVYAPHDLSAVEMNKWRRPQRRQRDIVDLLGINPLDMYRNFSMITDFMTPHGRIKSGALTGLRPPNQRKMAKAIRRAIGLGLHPSVHRHPEILYREVERTYAQNMVTPTR
ncbi:ribosomal protein S18 [Whalleya microplaca]|nr:ribosomal protein S18 [Whalleya microplaca]